RPAVGPIHRSRPGIVMLLPRYRYPSDTSDVEWALLEGLLPSSGAGGGPAGLTIVQLMAATERTRAQVRASSRALRMASAWT
ncbi:hypothetical protein ACFROD_50340, partial [Streptomyces mirabilis]